MHPRTRKCYEFLVWRSRFEDSTDVAPEGASYGEILASLNGDERATTTELAADRGEPWVVRNWAFLRIQFLYVRSLLDSAPRRRPARSADLSVRCRSRPICR
jgi:hypothetical protein